MAARVVCLVPKYNHITPLLKDFHWVPVKHRIMFKILLLVYKVQNGIAPVYLVTLLKPKAASCYNLRNQDNLQQIPNTKYKTFGDRAFFKAGPTLWNSLPLSLRNQTNTETFIFIHVNFHRKYAIRISISIN